jgi:hypothetical protein
MIELDSTDLRRIRGAIREWKGDPAVAESFDSGRLKEHVDRWAAFVRTDWANWDASEYDQDLGARY